MAVVLARSLERTESLKRSYGIFPTATRLETYALKVAPRRAPPTFRFPCESALAFSPRSQLLSDSAKRSYCDSTEF